MPNYIFTDENGQKQTVNDHQLRVLAARGTIRPETPLETDSGHKGTAGQISGLEFNTADISPQPSTTPNTQVTKREKSVFAGLIIFSVLMMFVGAFTETEMGTSKLIPLGITLFVIVMGIVVVRNVQSTIKLTARKSMSATQKPKLIFPIREQRKLPVILGAIVILFGFGDFIATLVELSNIPYFPHIPGIAAMQNSSGVTYGTYSNRNDVESNKSGYMRGLADFIDKFSEKHLEVQAKQLKAQLRQRLLLDLIVVCFGTLVLLQAHTFGGNNPGENS